MGVVVVVITIARIIPGDMVTPEGDVISVCDHVSVL